MMSSQAGMASTCPVTMITGYRGLAEVLTKHLSSIGHRLSVLVRNQAFLSELKAQFPNVYFHAGDLGSRPSLQSWCDETLQKFGGVDLLINNAAIQGPGGRLGDIDFHEFERTIEIDYIAQAFVIHRLLPTFKKQHWGMVISISGGGATFGRPFFSAYATSKCALVRLTETLALEYPELRFYAISPGAMRTAMVGQLAGMSETRIEHEALQARKFMESGGGDPMKTARLIEWLSREKPSHLSGRLLSAIHDDYENASSQSLVSGWWTLRRVDEMLKETLGESK